MPIEGRVVERRADLVIATYDNVFISVWRTHAQRDHLERIQHASVELASRHPGGIATLTVLSLKQVNRLADVDRAAAERANRAVQKSKLADAFVVDIGGLTGATIRAIATGINLVNRNTYPSKFFATIPPAAEWLATVAKNIDHRGLEQFVKML
jgi:hypothetical protein